MLFLTEDSRRWTVEIKYFSDTDTAIIAFSKKEVVETRELSENLYIDLDEDGNPVYLTVEHAKTTAHLPNISFEQFDKASA
jgi:uncharacterized protein YuzE